MNNLLKPKLENYYEKKPVARRMNGKIVVAIFIVFLLLGTGLISADRYITSTTDSAIYTNKWNQTTTSFNSSKAWWATWNSSLLNNSRLFTPKIEIIPIGDYGSSTSTGGVVTLLNTLNAGAGFIIYSNHGAGATGRLMNIRSNNPAFDQAALHVDYSGTQNAVEIKTTSNDSTSQALNINASDNSQDTTLGIWGTATGKGVVKIVHNKNGTDTSSSAISIMLKGQGTGAKGIFIDTAFSSAVGDLLNLRRGGIEKLVVSSRGNITIGGKRVINASYDSAIYSNKWNATTNHLNDSSSLWNNTNLLLRGFGHNWNNTVTQFNNSKTLWNKTANSVTNWQATWNLSTSGSITPADRAKWNATNGSVQRFQNQWNTTGGSSVSSAERAKWNVTNMSVDRFQNQWNDTGIANNSRLYTPEIEVTPTGSWSASTSVGGAMRLTNTLNGGAGLIIYSNFGAGATGRLLNIRADNSLFPQPAFHVDYDGTANAVEIKTNANDSSAQALNINASDNSQDTTVGIWGTPTGKGVVKITHNMNGSDSSSSALSILLRGSKTGAKGIFMDTTFSNALGDLLNLRLNGVEKFVVSNRGNLTLGGIRTLNGTYDNQVTYITNSKGNLFVLTEDGLRNAIFDLNTTSGGKVTVPVCNISFTYPLRIPSNVWIQGSGNLSILYLANNANTQMIRSLGWASTAPTASCTGIKLSDLSIDGNMYHQVYSFSESNAPTMYHAINFIWTNNSELDHVSIRKTLYAAVYWRNSNNIRITKCNFDKIGLNWSTIRALPIFTHEYWQMNALWLGGLSNFTVDNCMFNKLVSWAIVYEDHSLNSIPCHDFIISNCIVRDCGGGIYTEAAYNGKITNCYVYNATNWGSYNSSSTTGITGFGCPGKTHDITFYSCSVYKCGNMSNPSTAGSGFRVGGNDTVKNCEVNLSYNIGMWIAGMNSSVTASSVKNIKSYGIYFYDGVTSKTSRNPTIVGNTIRNTGGSAIYVRQRSTSEKLSNRGGIVSNNNIMNSTASTNVYGIWNQLNNITFSGNSISGFQRGIISDASYCVITGNKVSGLSSFGIVIGSNGNVRYNIITGNVVTGATTGIYLDSVTYSSISNNVVTKCSAPISEITVGGFNMISNNQVYGNTANTITRLSGNTTVIENLGWTTESQGTVSIPAASGRITIATNMSCLPNCVYVTALGNSTCVNGMDGFNATYTGTGGTYIVRIMCRGNLANACTFSWYVSNVTGGTRHNN